MEGDPAVGIQSDITLGGGPVARCPTNRLTEGGEFEAGFGGGGAIAVGLFCAIA
jgi:hypothetical protein